MALTIPRRATRLFESKAPRALNALLILLWRMGFGALLNAAPRRFGRLMILGSVGRRTGRMHRVPLSYATGDRSVYVVAASGADADWYRNLQADPRVELWLPEGKWSAFARRVDDPEERLRRLRQVLSNQGRSVIEALGVDPAEADDERLRRATIGLQAVRLSFDTRVWGSKNDGSWLAILAGLAAAALWKLRGGSVG
jgi:deazaflavin-dependent oxidoreductase (nitroreductase family)